MRKLGIRDSRVQFALHEGRSLVVFDVSKVSTLRHFDVFGKALRREKEKKFIEKTKMREGKLMHKSRLQYLLLEVANGILISIGEEIEDIVFDVVLLKVVHQVGTIALKETREKAPYL